MLSYLNPSLAPVGCIAQSRSRIGLPHMSPDVLRRANLFMSTLEGRQRPDVCLPCMLIGLQSSLGFKQSSITSRQRSLCTGDPLFEAKAPRKIVLQRVVQAEGSKSWMLDPETAVASPHLAPTCSGWMSQRLSFLAPHKSSWCKHLCGHGGQMEAERCRRRQWASLQPCTARHFRQCMGSIAVGTHVMHRRLAER